MKNLKSGDLLVNRSGRVYKFCRYEPRNSNYIHVDCLDNKSYSGVFSAENFKRKDEVFIKSGASVDPNKHDDEIMSRGLGMCINAILYTKPYSAGAFVVHKDCPIDWAIVGEITGNSFKANVCSECTYGCEDLKVSDYRVANKLEKSLIILSLKDRR